MLASRRVFAVAVLLVVVMCVAVGAVVAQTSTPEDTSPTANLSIEATVGASFMYQGRLLDNGRPANGTYNFRFRLYNAASGGTRIGPTNYRNNVRVSNGLFTVYLNFGDSAFAGNARWLEIAVRPGTSTGAYTVLSPRQPIYPVPYALGLRPGAIVRDEESGAHLNRLVGFGNHKWKYGLYGYAEGTADDITYIGVEGAGTHIGVSGRSASSTGYGGYFVNNASGGGGLFARGKENADPDLVLGGTTEMEDDGVLASDPILSSSDIVIRANDNVRIDLDHDKNDNDSDFEIYDENGRLVFGVDDSGAIRSRGVSYLFIPGTEAVPHFESADTLTLRYYGRGSVRVRTSRTGVQKMVLPIQMPAVLYGQPVRIASMRVYYRTSNARTYIGETHLYRQKLDGGYYNLIADDTDRKSTTFITYSLDCTVSQCRLTANEGFLTALLQFYFGNTGDEIVVGGIRLTLEHN